ncbi:MAG: peptide deformylase [Thermoanaerobaculia bacterium]|nr:peptide deformylase [Thermoanaerobaculia bacterium]
MIRPVLLLGDPGLVAPSREVERDDLEEVERVATDLRDTLLEFRRRHGVGRGIAAPQIAEPIRVVYLHWPEERVLINPVLDRESAETFELWDDCMSFPELLVRVRRHRSCRLTWRDLDWKRQVLEVETADLSELLQHEVDHLDGVLAVARAVEPQAFALRPQLEAAGELPERYGIG